MSTRSKTGWVVDPGLVYRPDTPIEDTRVITTQVSNAPLVQYRSLPPVSEPAGFQFTGTQLLIGAAILYLLFVKK